MPLQSNSDPRTLASRSRRPASRLLAGALCAAAAQAAPTNGATYNGVTYPTIQDALNQPGAGLIVVNAGTYQEDLLIAESSTLTTTGFVHVLGKITISGSAPTLDGFEVSPVVTGTSGLRIVDSSPTILNCTFHDFQAGLGGAVNISTTTLMVPPLTTFRSCVFRSNRAAFGGAIYVMPETSTKTAPDLSCTGCLFELNGATVADHEAEVMIFGGGCVYLGIHSSGFFEECKFLDNSSGKYGGAIMAEFPDNLTIVHSLIQRNACEEAGGGVYISPVDQLTIRDTVFADNTAISPQGWSTSGGGLFAHSADGGNKSIFNCLFTRNVARAGGGASLIGLNASIGHCTFSQNTASWTGGGLVLTDTFVTIGNSIFWGNTAGLTPSNAIWTAEINFGVSGGGGGGQPIVNFCDIRGASQPTWQPALGSQGPHLDADPVFHAGLYVCKFTQADTSGFFLRSGSPCIDAGPFGVPFTGSAWVCTNRNGNLPGDVNTADLGFHYPDSSCP